MKKLFLLILFLSLLSLLIHPIIHADVQGIQNMNISASVKPQQSDYQFSLVADNNPPTMNNHKFYNFTITYGTKQSAAFDTANTIITFDWSKVLSPNNMYLFDYAYGSASEAYGGAKPILGDRNVTWIIPNLPPGTTNQTVSIRLFANTYDQSTTAFPIYFTATMTNQYVTMPDQNLTEYYQFIAGQPGPTATPGPQPTATPTPSPPPPPLYTVDISRISQNDATITLTTKYPSKESISYGTSPTNLSHTISSTDHSNHAALTLPDLLPDTQYYFQITITSIWGYSKTSEIYTFRTAKQALAALPLTGTAVISSSDSVLLSEVLDKNMSPGFALLTSPFSYDVSISPPQQTVFKSMKILVGQQYPDTTIEMSRQQNGIFATHMSSLTPSTYMIWLKTLDETGTLNEQKIAVLKIIAPLSVSNKQTKKPIENARIFLKYFDQSTNSYKPLSDNVFSIEKNPSYTDSNGVYAIILPPGKYKAETAALFYDPATVAFILGRADGQRFPQIQLTYDPFNFASLFIIGKIFIVDLISSIYGFLQSTATSSRLFFFIAVIVTGAFVFLSFLLFLLKSHTSLKYLPLFFLIHVDRLMKKQNGKYLFGKVADANGNPLSLVQVEIEDADSKTILRHTTTNKTGKFYFLNTFTHSVNLIFFKEGFQQAVHELSMTGFPEKGLEIILELGSPHQKSAVKVFKKTLRDALGMLFETALVLSILLEILFFFSYGFAKTSPYLAISLLNIFLWLFYIHEHH